jgi:hypothetical protein
MRANRMGARQSNAQTLSVAPRYSANSRRRRVSDSQRPRFAQHMVAQARMKAAGCEKIDGYAQGLAQFDFDADQIGDGRAPRHVHEKIEIAAVHILTANNGAKDANIRRPDAGYNPAHGIDIGFERFGRFHFIELFFDQ